MDLIRAGRKCFGNRTFGFALAELFGPTTHMASPRVTGGKYKFDFAAVGGFSYIAQYKEALQPGEWTDFAWFPEPTATTIVNVEDPLTTTNRFYRIIIPATWP